MSKNKDLNLPSKEKQIEYFDITIEANRYYPTSSSKIGSGVSTYRRPKSSGGNQRFSSFKKA
jgi:hypothetical protein